MSEIDDLFKHTITVTHLGKTKTAMMDELAREIYAKQDIDLRAEIEKDLREERNQATL